MSSQPVWIVNGGATTMTSPTPQPSGSYLPVWVVNATDSVSKLNVPTTLDITSSANSAPVIKFVNSGSSNDSISITSTNNTNSSKKIVIDALATNLRYSSLSNKEHTLSLVSTSAWNFADIVYLGGNDSPLSSDKSYALEATYSLYMPIGQTGFAPKTSAFGVRIPSSSMWRLSVSTFCRILSGVTYNRKVFNGYCDPSGTVYLQTGSDNDSSSTVASGAGYVTTAGLQNLTNVFKMDYVATAYTGSNFSEYVWGSFKLNVMRFVS